MALPSSLAWLDPMLDVLVDEYLARREQPEEAKPDDRQPAEQPTT
jgi:hypothetical protein